MFGKKQDKQNKLAGPQVLSDLVRNDLTSRKMVNPELIVFFRAVLRPRSSGPKAFDIRIFDPADAEANKVQVRDYSSLDSHPNLIFYEGWFDSELKQIELEEKKKAIWLTTFPSKEEIQQKVEAMTEPASEIFFYMNKGSGVGGPLGKGACIVQLTPQEQGKKKKKYTMYFADIVDGKLGDRTKAFDADKSKDVAPWIKESCDKRLY